MRLGARQILNTSKRAKKRASFIIFLSIIFIAIVITVFYIFYALRPAVINMAKARAKEIGVMTINRVVSEKLKEEGIGFSDLLSYTYDENGKISSLSGNVSIASKLKSELAIEVTEAIRNIDKSEIGITLGTLTGVDILYGTGPEIPIEIKPYGYAETDIKTKFHEEGINQTAFEVVADVSANVSILMPTIARGENITTTVPIVSAIIVGDVPESYTNVDRDGLEYEDDVLQLAE